MSGGDPPLSLGAEWDGRGVHFAVFSECATGVDLCFFDHAEDGVETMRVALQRRADGVWHAYLADAHPGRLYGYRVHGSYQPRQGQRFNPHKLLIDPYAKAIAGEVRWDDAVYGYTIGAESSDLSFDACDSAAFVPKSLIVDPAFDWEGDRAPRIPWERTVIYECHVKGMTARHPDVPSHLRGTYLGLACSAVIDHLLRLGVTAVELLPIHHGLSRRVLVDRGLRNYWGYDTLGFFAPDARFASGCHGEQVREFQTMVKLFHRAGIEVILDVVYNHTVEGDKLGPTLSLRGFDNAAYYRLNSADRRYYENVAGCGNALNTAHPAALRLVLDSLRYWVNVMHVDGFRFDLTTTLTRGASGRPWESSFVQAVQEDPVLSKVKLIAEPWDLGSDGYQLGRFPRGWAEWNDQYRDTVRRFWRGDAGQVAVLATRLAGSSDLFAAADRGPCAGVNFVTCHDGFTLADLVSHERKHNEANGENSRDGNEDNLGRSWGVEGPTEHGEILELRDRVQRSFLATLAFSLGVPMISSGDELGRTQRGNNNAYCQDNELTWLDWQLDERRKKTLAFTRRLFALRSKYAHLFENKYFRGAAVEDGGLKDLTWLRADGEEMRLDDWRDPDRRVLGARFGGRQEATEVDGGGILLLILNGSDRDQTFPLPRVAVQTAWQSLLNTASPEEAAEVIGGREVDLPAHTLMLLAAQ